MTATITRQARLYVFTLAAVIVTLAGFGAARAQAHRSDAAPEASIEIDNFKFGVVNLTVAAGTTVTWTNRDDVPHTVASATKLFKSKPLDTGDTFSYTFKDAGTFEYYCSMHPRMTGKIVVK